MGAGNTADCLFVELGDLQGPRKFNLRTTGLHLTARASTNIELIKTR